jgi:hypothetical protein
MEKNTDSLLPSLIFLFVDGVGIGPDDPARNPFCQLRDSPFPFIAPLPPQDFKMPFCLKAVDATLDVAGTPQSGSGQTTLFTGIPYPRLSGEHAGSYPTLPMRQILVKHNLLRRLVTAGCPARFFNAYPYHAPLFRPPHLKLEENGSLHFSDAFPPLFRRRISATTVMMLSTGQEVADETSLRQEQALYQDFGNQSLIAKGSDLPPLTPSEAGKILARAGREHPGLTLFEFFLSDQTGHRGSLAEAVKLLGDLAEFTTSAVAGLDPDKHTLLLCSDHGNIEEMDHAGHTRNPVPLWIWGRGRHALAERIGSIADLTPAILAYFGVNNPL